MQTRVAIICAGPTPWDDEGRLVGNSPLPLSPEAIDPIRRLTDGLPEDVAAVYAPVANEACQQAGKLIAQKFSLRLRDAAALDAVHLGLWEGLRPEEIRARFPTVFPQWEEQPLTVTPPDGEPLVDAIDRIAAAMKRILRKNKGLTVALALRPMALEIVAGVLAVEPPQTIVGHLHQQRPMATIELSEDDLSALLD